MIASMVIVYREVLEMSIVLGVLLAATKVMPESRRWIGGGAVAGIAGAALLGWFMEALESSVNGEGEFIFNAAVLSLASLMIGWTLLWMRRHGREVSIRMRSVGMSVIAGELPLKGLLLISFAAVLREGSEALFFMFGFLQSGQEGATLFAGGMLGIALGAATGLLLYRGLIAIQLKYIFAVTGVLLILLAAGMASQAAWYLVAIDALPALADPLWNSSAWLPQESIVGKLMRVLIGYDDHPSGMQFLVFVVALGVLLLLYRIVSRADQRP